MVSLLQHAENFQRALDRLGKGGTSAAADAAGWDLYHSFQTTMNPSFVDFEPDTEALEPIILRTKLAASIVSFLQRFQWADVTVQMLAKPPESVYSPVGIASEILRRLFETAELSSQREVLAELFKQVCPQSQANYTSATSFICIKCNYNQPQLTCEEGEMANMNADMAAVRHPECSHIRQQRDRQTAEGSESESAAELCNVSS